MSALTLLGNVGTTKSIAVMELAESSRNHAVRVVARSAVQKINVRQRQSKSDEKK